MFDFTNPKFEGCNVQMNAQDGTQNNNSVGSYSTENVIKICDELKSISDENEEIRKTIDDIKSELKKGNSKNKVTSLLGKLRNAITVITVANKFPDVVEKVKEMIANILD